MNRQVRMILRLAVGAYIIYLAYMVISSQIAGDSGISSIAAYGFGTLFILGGIGTGVYAVMRYMKDKRAESQPAEGIDSHEKLTLENTE